MSIPANRWLTWQPKRMETPEPTQPTEPTYEGGFVGFEGTGEGPFQFIEGDSPSSEVCPDSRPQPNFPDPEPTAPAEPFLGIKRESPRGEPTKPTKPPSLDEREAALAFVNRAGARLVRACPVCHPAAPAGARLLILVPAENDGPDFRAAIR